MIWCNDVVNIWYFHFWNFGAVRIADEVLSIADTFKILKEFNKILTEKLGISNLLQKNNEYVNRINVVFYDYKKNKDKNELIRMLKNFIPFELSKKILVYEDKIKIIGMNGREVMQELDLSKGDWLDYVYKHRNE